MKMANNIVFDRIKRLAESHGKSIVDIEADLGLSKNYLYKWKKSSPSSDKLSKVADYFQTSTDYLLGRTDNPSPTINSKFNNTALTWNDLGIPIPYSGYIPKELKETYSDLAKSYFKRHPELMKH